MRRVIRTKSPKAQESSWPSNNKKEKATESRNLEEVVGGGPVARLLLPKTNTSGPPHHPTATYSWENELIFFWIHYTSSSPYLVTKIYEISDLVWHLNPISELPMKNCRLRMTHSHTVTRNKVVKLKSILTTNETLRSEEFETFAVLKGLCRPASINVFEKRDTDWLL